MIVFPNCKINLGLRIIRKRPDGFHDIETVFYPIPFCDVLEIIPVIPEKNAAAASITIHGRTIFFSTSGIPIQGTPESNLCIKGCAMLFADFPGIPSFQLHLHKNIPMGAGLGGGSSDGAYTIKLLNEYFHLGMSLSQLESYAIQLGSDCPFFLKNSPFIARGRGEKMETVTLDLSDCSLVLVDPGIHIATGRAFSKISPSDKITDIASIISSAPENWKHELINDFEVPAFNEHPLLEVIKQTLYASGALYASMTGSGSVIYGLYRTHQPEIPELPDGCKSWTFNRL
ncbi:MAG TPA: 4-(cytidine 5'-diphospho)-2-C-methyl-D-erythritol kinase [Flavitalea sp.]|nr:4-(cytidine 5'-diphospho)-2-C-methyl-D-erythritol kinase [Flavitalea sp.]